MSSGSVSTSISDNADCCSNVCDPCEDWLQFFCNYIPVTVVSCGKKTEFAKARQHGIKMTAIHPQAGIHPMDRIFELSSLEHDIVIGPGAKITDAAGTVWTVYSVEDIPTFCIKRVWARSVVACFGLLGDIDILEETCECEDGCDARKRFKRVAHTKGNILASTGTSTIRNDSTDLVYRFTCDLAEWPLQTLPQATTRLEHKGKVYRIMRVDDRGGLMPFSLDLEVDHGSCC